mgnify:FL=1
MFFLSPSQCTKNNWLIFHFAVLDFNFPPHSKRSQISFLLEKLVAQFEPQAVSMEHGTLTGNSNNKPNHVSELLAFLSSQPWLTPLSPNTMMQLQTTFKLAVILKDAICFFNTQCSPTARRLKSSYQRLTFLHPVTNQPTSIFSLEIILGMCHSQTTGNHPYPSSLFFRIHQQFYLVNHTIIDELSFPKDPSTSVNSSSISTKQLSKMPQASMQIGHFQMGITFSECAATTAKDLNVDKEGRIVDMATASAGSVQHPAGTGGVRITRLEAVQRLSSVAFQMNQSLQFAVLSGHPIVLADTTSELIWTPNHGSSGERSPEDSNDDTRDGQSCSNSAHLSEGNSNSSNNRNSNSTIGKKDISSQSPQDEVSKVHAATLERENDDDDDDNNDNNRPFQT